MFRPGARSIVCHELILASRLERTKATLSFATVVLMRGCSYTSTYAIEIPKSLFASPPAFGWICCFSHENISHVFVGAV